MHLGLRLIWILLGLHLIRIRIRILIAQKLLNLRLQALENIVDHLQRLGHIALALHRHLISIRIRNRIRIRI